MLEKGLRGPQRVWKSIWHLSCCEFLCQPAQESQILTYCLKHTELQFCTNSWCTDAFRAALLLLPLLFFFFFFRSLGPMGSGMWMPGLASTCWWAHIAAAGAGGRVDPGRAGMGSGGIEKRKKTEGAKGETGWRTRAETRGLLDGQRSWQACHWAAQWAWKMLLDVPSRWRSS